MKIRIIDTILYLLIAFGIILSIINFFHFRSLWLDEASLALNIVNKPLEELLRPLDYNQVAPIGFLLVEKIFTIIFGSTDWSLRILPLLLYFSSVYLMYRLSFKIFSEKTFALFASAFFALSYFPLYYSSEAKQYMVDIFIALIITLSTILCSKKNIPRKWWTYAILGAVSVWFSNISVILLFSAGLFLIYTNRKEKENYLPILVILSSWLFSFVIYYLLFIHNHPTKQMMVMFWSNANAFFPKNILSKEFYVALFKKIEEICELFGYDIYSILFIPVLIPGFFYLLKKKTSFVLLFPILVHLILSYFKIYPFDGRLILYLYPSLIILFVGSIYMVYSLLKTKTKEVFVYLLIIPILFHLVVLRVKNFPFEKEEIKHSLTQLNTNITNENKIYVYYGAYYAFSFYKKNFPAIAKLDEENIIIGKRNRKNWNIYNEEIRELSGGVWILFSHVYKNERMENEEHYILELFKSNNFEIIEEYRFKGSSVYKAIK